MLSKATKYSASTLLIFVIGCQPHFGSDSLIGPREELRSILMDGQKRQYLVHLPPKAADRGPLPAVIFFHGAGGNARNAKRQTSWHVKADEKGFIAVFPEGSRPDQQSPPSFRHNPQSWNDGSGRLGLFAVREGIDDVRFAEILIGELIRRYHADPARIYAVGFSNGASMAFRLARELSNGLSAVAAVAGADWTDTPPSRPISLIYITGSQDPLNPLHGGPVRIGARTYGTKPPVRAQVDRWATLLRCPLEPQSIHVPKGVRGWRYGPCAGGTEVLLYVVEGMGHVWPGGRRLLPGWIVGSYSDAVNATDLIWEFFRRHKRD